MAEDDDFDYSPLVEAAKRGYSDQIEELLAESKDELNKTDSLGNTAVIWAAGGGHLDAVRVLVENGADVLISNNGGDTALHKAAWKQKKDCCDYLVQHGAGPSRLATNKGGKLPFDLARDDEVKRAVAPPVQLSSDTADDNSDDEAGSDD
eukprot:TRINITY_DN30770_c0_g1_i1.p1 TRINITY_DN30770_c0_g1~~TRINITY_DN30770_c0_g1_i1.p1  ORF type:complete len:150 (-),score=47.40 TRINITY_DN30770_c0_g1_i1:262-711(-)